MAVDLSRRAGRHGALESLIASCLSVYLHNAKVATISLSSINARMDMNLVRSKTHQLYLRTHTPSPVRVDKIKSGVAGPIPSKVLSSTRTDRLPR